MMDGLMDSVEVVELSRLLRVRVSKKLFLVQVSKWRHRLPNFLARWVSSAILDVRPHPTDPLLSSTGNALSAEWRDPALCVHDDDDDARVQVIHPYQRDARCQGVCLRGAQERFAKPHEARAPAVELGIRACHSAMTHRCRNKLGPGSANKAQQTLAFPHTTSSPLAMLDR